MGSISGAFALVAFIGGLFCRRLKIALIVGGVLALLDALLVIIGLWDLLAGANLPYLFWRAVRRLSGHLRCSNSRLLHAAQRRLAGRSPALALTGRAWPKPAA
jgi:hypothetical protein